MGEPGAPQCSSSPRREEEKGEGRGISSPGDSLIPLGYLQPETHQPGARGAGPDQLSPPQTPT